VVTGLWAWFFPALRNTESLLPEREPEAEENIVI